MKLFKNQEVVTEEITTTRTVPAMWGKFLSMSNWNGGTIAVTTTYGLYSVYRNQDGVEITLISVFKGDVQ